MEDCKGTITGTVTNKGQKMTAPAPEGQIEYISRLMEQDEWGNVVNSLAEKQKSELAA